MNNPLIQHRCTCGYHLLSNPDAEKKWTLTHKGFARIFHPCSKCLRSQAEGMVEAIEGILDKTDDLLDDQEMHESKAFYDAIEIIKEVGGL